MAIKHARSLRQMPKDRGFIAITDEIKDTAQSDRAVAIVGASYVDLVLLETISSRLPLSDEGVMKKLFEDRGALESFGARIQLGYLLKAYGKGIYQDLGSIKDIRNAFAHSAEAMSFERPDIALLASIMNSPKKIPYRGQGDPSTPRERYVRAIELVADLLLSDMTLRAAGRSGEALLQMAGRR